MHVQASRVAALPESARRGVGRAAENRRANGRRDAATGFQARGLIPYQPTTHPGCMRGDNDDVIITSWGNTSNCETAVEWD